jgi:hypothetical protein
VGPGTSYSLYKIRVTLVSVSKIIGCHMATKFDDFFTPRVCELIIQLVSLSIH